MCGWLRSCVNFPILAGNLQHMGSGRPVRRPPLRIRTVVVPLVPIAVSDPGGVLSAPAFPLVLHVRRRLRRRGASDAAMRLRQATLGLAERHPHFSAREVITRSQAIVFAVALTMAAGAVAFWPGPALTVAVMAMAADFLFNLTLRCALAVAGRVSLAAGVAGGELLPFYSILVPLHREAGMVPDLARALAALDYPPARREVLIVVEADDGETLAAVRAARLRTIVVPPGLPRTKPKACNYALPFVRGEFVVVYDAEDRPEPDQLRKAVAAFRRRPAVSCFQARLEIDRGRGWIARMFALDYALWFRLLLPGLARLKAPIPLGGTSNHFRTKALVAAGGWDPFNVTEDADLGVRLARLGYHVAILNSATFEEAPPRLDVWLCQRTRWMKGYMQTFLVHTRAPGRLVRELGFGGALLFLTLIGGAIWSAFINPLLWMVCVVGLVAAPHTADALGLFARTVGLFVLAGNVGLAAIAGAGARPRAARGGRRRARAARRCRRRSRPSPRRAVPSCCRPSG